MPKVAPQNSQSGQIAVIVFLIMAVLLVIGLSLATRTSRDIELANQQEDTTRVFNAAETGIEQALSDEDNFEFGAAETLKESSMEFNQAQVATTITQSDDVNLDSLQPGVSATVYTTGTAGTVKISWGSGADCNAQAAIIVSAYYIEDAQYKAFHQGYRPGSCPSTGYLTGTNFTASDDLPASGFTSGEHFVVPAGTQFIRVKPLFRSTTLDVRNQSGNVLDDQSHLIRSQAVDDSGTSTEVRTIEVTRQRPAPPSILDYALYSGGTLVKE